MTGKSQIVDRMVARGASRSGAAAAVDAVLDEITAALAAGERVTLTGFGTFEAAARAERTARNPRTGAVVAVPATTVARFRPGTALRVAVAGGGHTPRAVTGIDAGVRRRGAAGDGASAGAVRRSAGPREGTAAHDGTAAKRSVSKNAASTGAASKDEPSRVEAAKVKAAKDKAAKVKPAKGKVAKDGAGKSHKPAKDKPGKSAKNAAGKSKAKAKKGK